MNRRTVIVTDTSFDDDVLRAGRPIAPILPGFLR
jgi:hypothetical protein